MRPIVVRAKTKGRKSEWIKSCNICSRLDLLHKERVYLNSPSMHSRFLFSKRIDWVEVRPETLGRYTECSDRNRQLLFEDDVIRDKDGSVWFIYWSSESLQFKAKEIKTDYDTPLAYLNFNEITLVGNIYDNPELVSNKKGMA